MNIGVDPQLTATEVATLREVSGWDYDEQEWAACLEQNLLNVSARTDEGEVVGAGFLCGNQRHAELVDLIVHPQYRHQGIGRQITQIILDYALSQKIKYVGLTYDKNHPWLKDFYESEGFQPIDFAMWHKSSLENRS